MKNLPDFHVHSRFSVDSTANPEETVNSALKIGISHLCFTEHKDVDGSLNEVNFYNDQLYTIEINRLRTAYKDSIEIFKGVEMDYQLRMSPDVNEFLSAHSFDFVLASVHAVRRKFVGKELFTYANPEEIYREYLQEIYNLSKETFYDVMGHLDYVKRYGSEFIEFNPCRYEALIEKILQNIISRGKGIEINTAGFRHYAQESYPSIGILKKYRKMGGEIISLGSDSHDSAQVGFKIEKALKILLECGWKSYYIFKNRQPVKININ